MKRKFFSSDDISGYILIAPFFAFFIIFVIIPVFYNIFQSFTNATGLTADAEFIFFDNYINLFKDEIFIKAMLNTLIFCVLSVFPLIFLGLAAAVALNSKIKPVIAARAVIVFPYIASVVAISMIWLLMFDPNNGILNKIMDAMGLPYQKWLLDKNLALLCLVFVNIWKNIGYVMLIYLAGLQTIPAQLYEAAKIDGAKPFRILFKITLPMLKPITIFVFITIIIESFKTFDQVRVMTNGGPLSSTTTVVHQIYLKAFSENKYGYAAAMSVILLIIIFTVTLFNMRLTGLSRSGKRV